MTIKRDRRSAFLLFAFIGFDGATTVLNFRRSGRFGVSFFAGIGATAFRTFDASIGDSAGEEANRTNGIVVARDDVVDRLGIAVRVDDGDDGNAQNLGFVDGDRFFTAVDDEECARETVHIFDAAQRFFEFFAFAFDDADFFLRKLRQRAIGCHAFKIAKFSIDERIVFQFVSVPPNQRSVMKN